MAGEEKPGIHIEISGHDAALAALGDMAGRLDHPGPLFDVIGAMLTASTQERFERETGPDGNPWPPSLRALFDGGKTLTDTSELRNSITWEADDAGVAVGSPLLKSRILQLGGTINAINAPALTFLIPGIGFRSAKSVTIPARPFLGLDADDEIEIVALAEEFVLEPVGGAA